MPEIGEIKRGYDIGYKKSKERWIWSACKRCGKERWVQLVGGEARWGYCRVCAQTYNRYSPSGSSHYNWKGGIFKTKDGYLEQTVDKNSPYLEMAIKTNRKKKPVLQHRLIMAEHLGRCLTEDELVHHLNGIRDDNRRENLVIVKSTKHSGNTLNSILMERIRQLENRIKER